MLYIVVALKNKSVRGQSLYRKLEHTISSSRTLQQRWNSLTVMHSFTLRLARMLAPRLRRLLTLVPSLPSTPRPRCIPPRRRRRLNRYKCHRRIVHRRSRRRGRGRGHRVGRRCRRRAVVAEPLLGVLEVVVVCVGVGCGLVVLWAVCVVREERARAAGSGGDVDYRDASTVFVSC